MLECLKDKLRLACQRKKADQDLFASHSGDSTRVPEHIALDANARSQQSRKLPSTSGNGHVESVKLLLPIIEQKSQSQKAAQKRLNLAVISMDSEILAQKTGSLEKWTVQAELFAEEIAAGANPAALTIPLDEEGVGMTSALVLAAARGWTKVVCLFLLDQGLDVNAVDAEGEHALLAALKRGRAGTAQLLLPRSCVTLADEEGESCLARAVESQLAEEAAAIVERLSHAERQQEFDAMREKSLAAGSPGGQIRAGIQALLLSKIEAEVFEKATGRVISGAGGSPNRPRSL